MVFVADGHRAGVVLAEAGRPLRRRMADEFGVTFWSAPEEDTFSVTRAQVLTDLIRRPPPPAASYLLSRLVQTLSPGPALTVVTDHDRGLVWMQAGHGPPVSVSVLPGTTVIAATSPRVTP
jgi:hypothetical protein